MVTFTYLIDENERDKISFDCDSEARERFQVEVADGQVSLYANKEGLITLAKLLLKMAHGSYSEGFHVHLRKDFNADDPEMLAVVLLEESRGNP